MKKIILALITIVSAASSSLNAQSLEMGDNMIHLGVGIGGKIGRYDFESQSPAFSFQYERTAVELGDVGILTGGGYVGYKTFKNSGTTYGDYKFEEKWSYITIGGRAGFHLTAIKNDKLDLYGGIMVSYNILSYSYSDNDPYPDDSFSGAYASTQTATVFVGARYFLTHGFGVYAELGSNINLITAGLSFRF